MQLPIYRRLDERLQILGLSLIEVGGLGGLYVFLSEALAFWAYGILFALGVSGIGFIALVILHQRCESHFLSKWLRFANLPEGTSEELFSISLRSEKAK